MGWNPFKDVANFFTGREDAKEAQKLQTERMQNAHQWEVNDLQKAGLNPVLSSTAGSAGSIAGSQVSGAIPNSGTGVMSGLASLAGIYESVSRAFTNEATSARELAQAEAIHQGVEKNDEVPPLVRYIAENPFVSSVAGASAGAGSYALFRAMKSSRAVAPKVQPVRAPKVNLSMPKYSEVVRNASSAKGFPRAGASAGYAGLGIVGYEIMRKAFEASKKDAERKIKQDPTNFSKLQQPKFSYP